MTIYPLTLTRRVALSVVVICSALLAACSSTETTPSLSSGDPITTPRPVDVGHSAPPDGTADEAGAPSAPLAQPEKPLSLAESLAVDPDFYYALVDDLFYAQYPDLQRRPLTQVNTPMEASLREEWWQVADIAAANLTQINVSSRRRLGSYRLEDYRQSIQDASALGVDEIQFRNAIAAQFHQLFPMLANYENGEESSGFQIWAAIAQEELQKIQQGQAFEQAER